MEKAFELKDGTIIYENDVRNIIVNGKEEEYDRKNLLNAAKKTATIQVVLNDGTKLNQSDINNTNIFGFNQ